MYQDMSAKNCPRDEGGQSETRVHLQSLEHNMLSDKEWSLIYFHFISVLMILYVQKSVVNPG